MANVRFGVLGAGRQGTAAGYDLAVRQAAAEVVTLVARAHPPDLDVIEA